MGPKIPRHAKEKRSSSNTSLGSGCHGEMMQLSFGEVGFRRTEGCNGVGRYMDIMVYRDRYAPAAFTGLSAVI